MPLLVNEIFYSIQGESIHAGWPCVFVRLTGCNLRCTYCDTRYAYWQGETYTVAGVLEQVGRYNCGLVEVTGGEPLIQGDTPRLIHVLLDRGYKVLLETNGSHDIGGVDERCIKIVDFKCPSSGEAHSNDLSNIAKLHAHDEVKLVISDRVDYEFAKEVLWRVRREASGGIAVHFSPVFGRLAAADLVEWILADNLPVRLNLQLHKLIWDPERRGV